MNKNTDNKDKSSKFNEDKFTYTKEDVDALKIYDSKEHVEQEDKKAGKKTVWY